MAKRACKFYRDNEADLMKDLGLVPTKNSGAGWIEKEDGYNDYILAQLKSTDAKSISIKKLDLEKLEYHAQVEHKVPVFVIQFLETNDVYLMAKPLDVPALAQYLECGECKVAVNDLVAEEAEVKPKKPKKVISSGNRDSFWGEKEKERENWKKRLKSRQ